MGLSFLEPLVLAHVFDYFSGDLYDVSVWGEGVRVRLVVCCIFWGSYF